MKKGFHFIARLVPHGERRAHARFKTSLRAKYRTTAKECVSWVRDISVSGVRLFLCEPLEVNTHLSIEIDLPFDHPPTFFRGQVMWTGKDNAGIKFDKIPQRDVNRIIAYIREKDQITRP